MPRTRRLCLAAAALACAATGALAKSPAEEMAALKAVPARVQGLWCGTGLLGEFSLRLNQRYQELRGTLSRHGRAREIEGRIEGNVLHTQSTRHGSLVLQAAGNELRVTGGEGLLALARGMSFRRAAGDRCAP
jgi:hypothetical protein